MAEYHKTPLEKAFLTLKINFDSACLYPFIILPLRHISKGRILIVQIFMAISESSARMKFLSFGQKLLMNLSQPINTASYDLSAQRCI